MSRSYDSARRKGGRTDFAGYLTIALRRRVIDWQRQRFGRTRWIFADRVSEPQRVDLLSLDGGEDPLGGSLTARGGDPQDSGDLGLRGISMRQIGTGLGMPSSWAADRLDELEAELSDLAGWGRDLLCGEVSAPLRGASQIKATPTKRRC